MQPSDGAEAPVEADSEILGERHAGEGREKFSLLSRPQASSARDNTSMSAGYVAILAVELHFHEARSLKGKRKHVLSAKAQLQNRFGGYVAEVDHHELWQRCALTAAFVAREAREAEELAARAEQWLSGREWELVRAEVVLVSPDD